MPRDLFAGPALLVGDPSDAMTAGRTIGQRAVAAIRVGAADRDLLLRAVLGALADAGYVVPPNATLRGVLERVQSALAEARR